jgi:asparagine synthase (glutamine-hydrolysing)
MCGWAAIIAKSGELSNATALLDEFDKRLRHRGPDEAGRRVEPGFAVVHRRLSIVDTMHGQQPMETEDGRVGLVFNGEIYNFGELRLELERNGRRLQTCCDTEVLLEMFVEYGTGAFERLDGMFTVFAWDFRRTPEGDFHVARDHLGIKPLYAFEDSRRIIFSSELQAILAVPGIDLGLSPEGILSYLTFRYVPAPITIVRCATRVEAGTRWHVQRGRITRWRFWDVPHVDVASAWTEGEAAEVLYALLEQSVRAQRMGDVAIGLLLSGGIDSTAIACLCHGLGGRYRTFNIGFPETNEFEHSSAVAKVFEQSHECFVTTVDEIAGIFPKIVDALDEPVADPAAFPLYVLCANAKQYVTVLLSGEGSDELFGGYPQYRHVLNGDPADQETRFDAFLRHSWYFSESQSFAKRPASKSRLLRHMSYFAERDLLDGMLAFDLKTWLPENLLMKADKITMSHSLEGRFPFLSRKLVEFAMCLPAAMKIRNDVGKRVLRRAFANRIPASILSRPKMGFSVPLPELLRRLRGRFMDLLAASRKTELEEYLDLECIGAVAKDHFSERRDDTLRLWTVLVLMQWYNGQCGSRNAHA